MMTGAAVVEELLAEVRAADRPDPGLALFVACFHWLADEARIDARLTADAAGGFFLERETPEPVSETALPRTLARIDAEIARDRRLEALRAAARELDDILDLPPPVRDAALTALETGAWMQARAGARRLDLPTAGGTRLTLWRLEPGAGPPAPDHAGRELSLVLSGAFRDAAGRHGRGDVAMGPLRLRPAPAAEPGEPCFILALTRAPSPGAVASLLDRTLKPS